MKTNKCDVFNFFYVFCFLSVAAVADKFYFFNKIKKLIQKKEFYQYTTVFQHSKNYIL